MSYTGYHFTNELSTNYASLCSNVNTSRPQHTCRHFVRRSQLSQPVVSCRQQPKASATTREQELSHTAHGHLQFLDLHVGTYILPSSLKSLSLKPAHFCKQLKTIPMAQPS